MMQLFALSSMYRALIAHGRLKVFWSHDKLVWRRGEGGGEKMDCRGILGDLMLRFPFEDLL